jgi:hypothetical protein
LSDYSAKAAMMLADRVRELEAENARLRAGMVAAIADLKGLSGRLHRSHFMNQSAVSSWLANRAGQMEQMLSYKPNDAPASN